MLDGRDNQTVVKAESSDALQKMQDEVAAVRSAGEPKCESSSTYNLIIDQVINTVYDPKSLGDQDALRNKYNCQIKSEEDAIKFADKALAELDDPYTNLYTRSESEMMKIQMAGQFYGIGMTLKNYGENSKGRSVIEELSLGGAAEAAGLKAGDLILSLNGEDVSKLSATEVSTKIRSDKPGALSIKVERDGKEIEIENLQRRLIEQQTVSVPVIKDGIAQIKISSFDQANTSEKLKKAIEDHPEAKAFIIDLRKNGGGLVIEAFKSLSLFMGSGKLAVEKERINAKTLEDDEELSYYKTDVMLTPGGIEFDKGYEDMPGLKVYAPSLARHPDLVDKPVVVLVDERSASASEIFAGAMKDNKEAVVIGKQTFGKGIGQTFDTAMPAGTTLAVTNLRLFTPGGNWVGDGHKNRIGIRPDVEVKDNEDGLEVSMQYLKNLLASKENRKAS